MIEIAISSDLANEHPRFMAECARRDHRLEVFDSGERVHATPEPNPAAFIGSPHPELGFYAGCARNWDPDEPCGCPICRAAARWCADEHVAGRR